MKLDKDRENYLGHSLSAPVGRWQKGKDIMWYTKGKEQQRQILDEEKRAMKEMDEDLLNAALGMQVKRAIRAPALDSVELKQLVGKGTIEREEHEIERIRGLGAAPAKTHEHIEKGESQLEKEIRRLKEGNLEPADDINRLPGTLTESHHYAQDVSLHVDKKKRLLSSDGDSRDGKDSKKSKKHHKDKKKRSKKTKSS